MSLVLATTVLLTGCGRKGNIDPPSTPIEMQNKRSSDGKEQVAPVADKQFILDKLL